MEEISIVSSSSDLEWRAGLSDTILKGTHASTILARFGVIWFSGFRGDLNVIFYQNEEGGGGPIIVFSSPCQRQCELLPSLGVRCLSSINFSHFNLLLGNLSAK
jgi:hypothetical protein